MKTFIVWLLLCGSTLALPASAQLADDPLRLQRQGIERVDAYVDHMRKTGDRVTRRPELARAEQELLASYRGFLGKGDLAGAALSTLRLGDARQQQDQWDSATQAYRETERLARQAGHPEHLAKALMGQMKVEFMGRKNLGAALALAL